MNDTTKFLTVTIEELRNQSTTWLIAFVRANKSFLEHGLPTEAKLIKYASEEIKRRNRESFNNNVKE